MNSMDFKYSYPLGIVWLCVLNKTRRFYHNYKEFGGILKVRHFWGQATLIIAPTVFASGLPMSSDCLPEGTSWEKVLDNI
jgi:hypothetical protein